MFILTCLSVQSLKWLNTATNVFLLYISIAVVIVNQYSLKIETMIHKVVTSYAET